MARNQGQAGEILERLQGRVDEIRGPIETVFRFVSDARTFCDWFTVFKEVHPDDPNEPIRVGSHTTMRVCGVRSLSTRATPLSVPPVPKPVTQ